MSVVDPNGGGPLLVPGGASAPPEGTGLVSVTAGVLDTPSTLAARVAADAAALRAALGLDRDALSGAPVVAWRLDETTGPYVSRGSVACPLTVTGAAVRDVARSLAGRTALRLPGTTGIYAAGPSGTTGLTAPVTALSLSVWVRWRGTTGQTYQTIACLQLDSVFGGNIASIYLGLRSADGFLRVVYTMVGESIAAGLSASGMSASAVVWRHLVVTYNGTLFTFYLDGQPIGTHTPSAGTQIDLGTTSRWAVGDIPGSTADHASADVADPRVYQSALTAADVEAAYARGMGGSAGP